MIFETQRLIIREYCDGDFAALHEIFSDPDTMRHYPHPFSEEETRRWIRRNMDRYAADGFGLWAVVLKESGAVIGDCGITMQCINGKMLPEIGYHIHKDYQRRGYGSEAALGCMKLGFERFGFDRLYSYMKYTNAASCGVALKNGMSFVEEYDDPMNVRTRVYAISREEWLLRADDCIADSSGHGELMRRCYELAVSAGKKGYDTFGALLAVNGEILAETENTSDYANGIFGHAEFNLVHQCADRYPDSTYENAVLYTSCAPCTRCMMAILSLGIRKIVYGVSYRSFNLLLPFEAEVIDYQSALRSMGVEAELIGPILEREGMRVFEHWGGRFRPLEELLQESAEMRKAAE